MIARLAITIFKNKFSVIDVFATLFIVMTFPNNWMGVLMAWGTLCVYSIFSAIATEIAEQADAKRKGIIR